MKKILIFSLLLFTTSVFATDYSAENLEVENFLAAHEVRRVTNYCRTDFLNCRSVVQYRDTATGIEVNSFEDRFISSTDGRSVSFRGFFLEQANGKFSVYSQNKLTPQVDINTVLSENQSTSIIFDSKSDLPSFQVHFLIVGTGEVIADFLVYDPSFATFLSDGFAVPLISQTNH